ncbi:MAG: hypothetical protein K2Y24_00780 [Pseudomonadaceae bacterium]|nr:hypothetical protein [Pseudomonadaceae bacterium]
MDLAGGVLLAHVGLGGLQALLGEALGGQLGPDADDAGGLAGAALAELRDAFGGQAFARCTGLALLILAPGEQAKGGKQGEAVAELAQGGHAATFCPPQPHSACRR